MARRRRSTLALSGEHARQALTILVQEGKLRASEVKKALQRRDRLIRDLRARLAALEAGVVKAGRRVLKDGFFPTARKVRTAKRRAARRKPRISAATRKIYQAQGRYMAALRNLSKGARKQIKAIREKSGVRAAIAAARRMATPRLLPVNFYTEPSIKRFLRDTDQDLARLSAGIRDGTDWCLRHASVLSRPHVNRNSPQRMGAHRRAQ